MTSTTVTAELQVYKPSNSSGKRTDADTIVPGTDIKEVEASQRVQDLIDSGRIRLSNNDASYTDAITHGDRIQFWASLSGDSNIAYGDDTYGTGLYGGATHVWTGYVRPTEYIERGRGHADLEFQADDFVFAVLDTRVVTNAFTDQSISADSNAILQRILADTAPELHTTQIQDVQTTITVSWNNKTLLEAVRELAERGDALLAQDDRELVFKRLGAITSQFTVQASDRGLLSVRKNDDELVNRVRVEGGQDIAADDTQTTQSSTTTVTSSQRVTQQLETTKGHIPQVEVYTNTSGSGDNVVVRLQEDDGNGSPRDVGNRDADVARRTLTSDFLADDGFTTFLLRPIDHRFYNPDPHLIVESDGSSGQDIGTDGGGTPTYKQYYSFPIETIVENKTSIDSYRQRDGVHGDDTLSDKAHTEQRGEAILSHAKDPSVEITFPAESSRAHKLTPGEGVTLNEPDAGFQGDAILLERRDRYDGARNELTTELTLQDIDTV